MDRAKHIVAIESSGRHASLALLRGEQGSAHLAGQVELSGDERTAQVLAPALQRLLADADWSPREIDLVAVSIGPGSFTGLRIGVTTAKAFAYAVGAEVIGVNTLEVLAAQAPSSPSRLWAIFDAQRQELFAARFALDAHGQLKVNRETSIIAQDRWLAELQAGDRVTGPALRRLSARLPTGVEAVPEEHWEPTAACVGRIAWKLYEAGQRDDVWRLVPKYYRPSAAEEKAAKLT